MDRFYVGYTTLFSSERLVHHNEVKRDNAFTRAGVPWVIFFEITCESIVQAKKIERHIKNMKSSTFIRNLKKYPDIANKLLVKYKSDH